VNRSLKLAAIALVALVFGMLTTTGTAQAATRHTVRMHDVAGSTLVGTWTLISDNQQGQLVIGSIDTQGNLTNSTAFGDPIMGTWDATTGAIRFIRISNGTTSGTGSGTGTGNTMASYEYYEGYLVSAQMTGSQQTGTSMLMLVGSFKSFGSSMNTGTGTGTGSGTGTGMTMVSEGGWYAMQAQAMPSA
jgi:hypothetical protein